MTRPSARSSSPSDAVPRKVNETSAVVAGVAGGSVEITAASSGASARKASTPGCSVPFGPTTQPVTGIE